MTETPDWSQVEASQRELFLRDLDALTDAEVEAKLAQKGFPNEDQNMWAHAWLLRRQLAGTRRSQELTERAVNAAERAAVAAEHSARYTRAAAWASAIAAIVAFGTAVVSAFK